MPLEKNEKSLLLQAYQGETEQLFLEKLSFKARERLEDGKE